MGLADKLTLRQSHVMLYSATVNRLTMQGCPMASGDKYVATLTSHWVDDLDNPFNNVFAYEGGAGASTADDLASALRTTLVSVLAPITSDAIHFDSVTVINLDDLADYAIATSGVQGSVGGQCCPKFVSWSYEYFRATRAVANGRKAFAGVSEAQQANGVPLDSGVIDLLTDVAEFLANDLDGVAVGVTYIPRIWRRAGTYSSGVSPDTFYPISAVGFKRISTQNSRKN